MAGPGKIKKVSRRGALTKALIFLALAGILISLLEFSGIRTRLHACQFQRIVSEAGLMGPALLLILCAVGTFLLVPGTVFVGTGAAVFGPLLGFACVWPGTIAGAVLSYFAARKLGRDFVHSLIGDRLTRYDDLIERNGFRAVLILRLMFVPLAPVNYGAGLANVRFWDYFLATTLGEAVTILVVTFFIGEIRRVWISGNWARLFSVGMVFSFLLLIALAITAGLLHRKYAGKPTPPSKSQGIMQ